MNITQAHLHCGSAGNNGPVVAFLFAMPGMLENEDVDGSLSSGMLMFEDLIQEADCGNEANNIASLYDGIKAGAIYLNVHSVANPAGEVRGQLLVH